MDGIPRVHFFCLVAAETEQCHTYYLKAIASLAVSGIGQLCFNEKKKDERL